VIGVDEAGRGALAGPVVCAAVTDLPLSTLDTADMMPLVVRDSKTLSERQRQIVVQQLFHRPNMSQQNSTTTRWAVAVVDVATIDKHNILQATLQGMQQAVQALVDLRTVDWPILSPRASIRQQGSYIVIPEHQTSTVTHNKYRSSSQHKSSSPSSYFALIDGNQIPPHLPCQAEAIVKGDAKEYVIAVASILAKVTRDTIMLNYHHHTDIDTNYSHYNFAQHKGYPTKAHRKALEQYGPSLLHRTTFAPVKHMLSSSSSDSSRKSKSRYNNKDKK
jgi:ribonuclease HII